MGFKKGHSLSTKEEGCLRDTAVTIRVNGDEKKQWQDMAKFLGISFADFVINSCRKSVTGSVIKEKLL